MNFIDAMRHVAENERAAVIRSDQKTFVWFDRTPFMAGMGPIGFRSESIDHEWVGSFSMTIEDVIAEDWDVYQPVPLPKMSK